MGVKAVPRAALEALAALVVLTLAAQGALGQTGVSGSVAFEDGSPAGGARVILVPGGYNTTADAQGNFTLEAPPGNYTLRASADNATSETSVSVGVGLTSGLAVRINRRPPPAAFDTFPLALLLASMVAVTAGGFYVNKRMAESGISINKTVVGGATVRKPFRRRRRHKAGPPPPPPSKP